MAGLPQHDYHKSPEQGFTALVLYLFVKIGPDILREGSTIRNNEGRLLALSSWAPDQTRVEETILLRQSERHVIMEPPGAVGDFIETVKPRGLPCANGEITRHLCVTGTRIRSPMNMSDECRVQKKTIRLREWRTMARATGLLQNNGIVPATSASQATLSRWALNFFQTITHDEVIYAEAILRGAKLIISWEKNSSATLPLEDSLEGLPLSERRQIERILACCDQRKFAILEKGMITLVANVQRT